MIEGVEHVAKRLWTQLDRVNARIRAWEARMVESKAFVRLIRKCSGHDLLWAEWKGEWRLLLLRPDAEAIPLVEGDATVRIATWQHLEEIEIALMIRLSLAIVVGGVAGYALLNTFGLAGSIIPIFVNGFMLGEWARLSKGKSYFRRAPRLTQNDKV